MSYVRTRFVLRGSFACWLRAATAHDKSSASLSLFLVTILILIIIMSDIPTPTPTTTTTTTTPSQEVVVPASSQEKEEEEEQNNTQDLPPLRLHATRVPERLSSSHSLPTPSTKKKHVRRSSFEKSNRGTMRSRSKSPSLKKQQGDQTATTSAMDGGSSLSSLEDLIDADILTDSKGMMELSLKEEEKKTHQLHLSSGSLAPVHERMSEETLEDVHAFSDLNPGTKTPSLSSRGNSTVGTAGDVGSYLLETLCEEEGEGEEDDDVKVGGGEVIFTNMENLTIHEELPDNSAASGEEGDTSLELSTALNTRKTV